MRTPRALTARRICCLFLVGLLVSLPSATRAQDADSATPQDGVSAIDPSANSSANPTTTDEASTEETKEAFDDGIEAEDIFWDENQEASEFDPQIQQVRQVAMLLGGFLLAVVIGVLVVYLLLQGLVCYLMAAAIKVLPEEHLQITTGKIWLLLLPCFNIVWAFIVVQGISGSFRSYFLSRGQTQYGDCHNQLGFYYCIALCCNFVPYLNMVSWLASIVLLIVYLVQIHQLKGHSSRRPQPLIQTRFVTCVTHAACP